MTSTYHWSVIYILSENSKQRKLEKWLLLGAEENLLAEIMRKKKISNYIADISVGIFSKPGSIKMNNIDVHYKIIDQTNCFNVKSLQTSLSLNKDSETYYRTVLNNITGDLNFLFSDISEIQNIVFNYFKEKSKWYTINSDIYSKMVPLLCVRYDNSLIININTLEIQHSKLIQEILMNLIDEDSIMRTILSKPESGWGNIQTFLDTLLDNSEVKIENVQRVKDIVMSIFSHDRYFISLIFWLSNEYKHYQLTSLLDVRPSGITVLHRRFGISDKYDKQSNHSK
ncbi:type II secretion system protein GspK [Yersinia sp. Marseille-Q3913]|uniref:type II secretion system protein GspK n=1 Tax=Yersinia sp. Marseille-Q3913 TaxID=2830769 RepID=UPI001BAFD95F|nr:type II secretion system protein GspK [Yersinia sp. Marseille-Q3913]MBS0056386.1 general secretion pathway protein GspK [Yersinia sp. Marseille-Q3913]